MQILTPEAESFFFELWDRHIEYLESEHDVTTPYEYLDYVGRLDDFEDPEKLKLYLVENEIPIDIFFQATPYHGQDIMYASLNPGMQKSIDQSVFENGNEYGKKIATVGKPVALAWSIASGMHGYLKDKKNPGVRMIIETMRKMLDPLPTQQAHEDYVRVESQEQLHRSYYGDVYLTRVFKYPSLKGYHLSGKDLRWAHGPFAEEIELVSPKLLVCGCKDAWLSVYDELVDEPELEIDPHNGSNLTSKYQTVKKDPDSAAAGVYEVPGFDMWVVTLFHESRRGIIDSDRLAENLAYVNERINWIS